MQTTMAGFEPSEKDLVDLALAVPLEKNDAVFVPLIAHDFDRRLPKGKMLT